jgi:hypothetical protein
LEIAGADAGTFSRREFQQNRVPARNGIILRWYPTEAKSKRY